MKCAVLSIAALAAIAGSIAIAQPTRETKPAAKPGQPASQPANQPGGFPADMPLPPGMTPEDMQACAEAGTPGEMHAWLVETAGTWQGKNKMWMGPGTDPMESECVTTVTPILDGRFVRVETSGEMPGMGPFNGIGINGFDNVTQKFQCTWIDNCGTGMMIGTGERSSDGRTFTVNYSFNCPINKKPANFRQIETRKGKDAMTLEMYASHPHTGEEYKMLEINYTRKGTIIGNGGR